MNNFELVIVSTKYCNYLRKFDKKVSYNSYEKEFRPFVGILFKIENFEYYAPLSSPKPKHLTMKNQMDFHKINGGKLGAINFNNMIPIPDTEYSYLDVNKKCSTEKEQQYQNLLKDQLRFLNREGKNLKEKAKLLYERRSNNSLNANVAKRCCDFKLLESKCEEYMKNN